MNTLTIRQIFSNLHYYQDQYLTIVNDADLYFTLVEDANIQVWPLGNHQVYLGDLLQLWFGDKWILNEKAKPLINSILREKSDISSEFNHYIFSIEGSTLTGKNQVKAWSIEKKEIITLNVDNLFQFYCVFKVCKRPAIKSQEITSFKRVI